MKRLFALSALLLPIYLFAQGFGSFSHDQPFLAGGITSIPDVPCNLAEWNPASNANTYALYDFNCLTLTDGQRITNLVDYGPHSQTLTTTNAPYCTNNVAEINNRKYGVFDTNYLMYSPGPEMQIATTIFIVALQTPISDGIVHTMFDNGANNVQVGGFLQNSFNLNNNCYVFGGLSPGTQRGPYAQPVGWTVTEVFWNGASSYVKTNNVTALTATFGQSRRIGVTLGADCNFTQHGKIKIAWAGFFTNALTATTSSNIFYYLTNRFNIQ